MTLNTLLVEWNDTMFAVFIQAFAGFKHEQQLPKRLVVSRQYRAKNLVDPFSEKRLKPMNVNYKHTSQTDSHYMILASLIAQHN